MIGNSKSVEYGTTIAMLDEIYAEQGMYYVLALLYDSQYDRDDIKKMMDMMLKNKQT